MAELPVGETTIKFSIAFGDDGTGGTLEGHSPQGCGGREDRLYRTLVG